MPGLSDYQRDLAAAVRQRQAAALWDPSAPGLALTGRIRESWCNGRARRAAPLTLSALSESDRDRIVRDWVAGGGGVSSFFEAEADAVLTFIAERLDAASHAASLCRFEHALIRAGAIDPDDAPGEPMSGMTMVIRSPWAELVELQAPIDGLLDAIDGRRPWPPIGDVAQRLLIAPGIAGKVRDASAVEIALWQAAGTPIAAARYWPVARSMVGCGALLIVPKALI